MEVNECRGEFMALMERYLHEQNQFMTGLAQLTEKMLAELEKKPEKPSILTSAGTEVN